MKRKAKISAVLISALLLISIFAYLGVSTASVNDITEEVKIFYQNIGTKTESLLKKAFEDWSQDGKIDDPQLIAIENSVDQKTKKQIVAKAKEQAKEKYPKFDQELVAAIYGGATNVNVLITYNNKEALSDIANIAQTEFRYTFSEINVVSVRNLPIPILMKLAEDPRVAKVHLNTVIRLPPVSAGKHNATEAPDTPITNWGVERIQVAPLWAQGFDGQGMVIGYVDTGVEENNSCLKGKIIETANFVANETKDDLNGHGTWVTGIGIGNNCGDYKGAAPNASALMGKAFDKNGTAWTDDVIAAMQWLVKHQPDVISGSFGAQGYSDDSHPLSLEVNRIVKQEGIPVAIAAGNSGQRLDYDYPEDDEQEEN